MKSRDFVRLYSFTERWRHRLDRLLRDNASENWHANSWIIAVVMQVSLFLSVAWREHDGHDACISDNAAVNASEL